MRALRHTGIVVRDLEAAERFYTELVGLRIVAKAEESGPFLDAILDLPDARATTVKMAAAEGGALLELLCFAAHRDVRPPAEPYSTGPTHVAFTVEDLAQTHARLSAAGVPFTTEPRVSPDGRALVTFCRDPEGNLLELVEELQTQENRS